VRRPSRLRIAVIACAAALAALGAAPAADAAEQQVDGIVYGPFCVGGDANCPVIAEPFPQCLRSFGCGDFDLYPTEGTFVNVRRRGSPTVIATAVVMAGRFSLELPPGHFVLRAIPPEGLCVRGELARLPINAALPGPYYVDLEVLPQGTPVGDGTCIRPTHP
jgi:hypothetical protein